VSGPCGLNVLHALLLNVSRPVDVPIPAGEAPRATGRKLAPPPAPAAAAAPSPQAQQQQQQQQRQQPAAPVDGACTTACAKQSAACVLLSLDAISSCVTSLACMVHACCVAQYMVGRFDDGALTCCNGTPSCACRVHGRSISATTRDKPGSSGSGSCRVGSPGCRTAGAPAKAAPPPSPAATAAAAATAEASHASSSASSPGHSADAGGATAADAAAAAADSWRSAATEAEGRQAAAPASWTVGRHSSSSGSCHWAIAGGATASAGAPC
jgi:hypothetical protein